MKNTLIRLTSEKRNGLFETFFNDSITIKPYSSIALQSCNIANFIGSIEINTQNDKIQVVISNDLANPQTLTIFLSHEVYTRTNIMDLINDIQDKLNDSLSATNGFVFGFQFNIMINHLNNLEISVAMDRTLNAPWVHNDDEAEYENCGSDGSVLSRTDGQNSDNVNASFAYGLYPFIKSAGVFQARIQGFTNNAGGAGVVLALVDSSKFDKINGGLLEKTDIDYGIEFPNDHANNYIQILNGVSTNTTLNPVLFGTANNGHHNDVLEIRVSNGFISLVIYQNGVNGGNGTTILTEECDRTKDYYPYLAFKGNCDVDEVSASYDPYSSNALDNVIRTKTNKIQHLGTTNPIEPADPDDFNNGSFGLAFEGLNLANFLGYGASFLLPAGSFKLGEPEEFDHIALGYVLKAPKRLDTIIQPERFLIELLNINLDSYDAFTSSRKNILATIHLAHRSEDFNTSIIQYEPNSLHYIALNNAEPLTLRNINARVITDRFDPIETEGFNSINLLILQEQ